MVSFKCRHFNQAMIMQSICWTLAYSLSYRDIEEMMQERGFDVDHSTLNRWVVHYTRELEKAFHKKKKRPGGRWRMDETYIKVKGQWRYYYRAVDKENNTIDFLLTTKRDKKVALCFLIKAISRNGQRSLINIYKSGANKADIKSYNIETHRRIKIRQ
ncbi:Mobile element protein [hydrothermal vent metagenome]|uniref:Mobile element protein n=1 Tax=hydrothermal vent metagenome TaxID=652676 RepID=A0A3B0YQE9_9ZZZZ